MNFKDLKQLCLSHGFTNVVPLACDTIELKPEVRQMCASDSCHKYNKCWSCPPGCGTLEECKQRVILPEYASHRRRLLHKMQNLYLSGRSLPLSGPGLFLYGSLWNAGNTGMPGKWSGILLWSLYDRLYQLLSS